MTLLNCSDIASAILAKLDLTDYKAWLVSEVGLNLGFLILKVTEEAIVGGNYKESRERVYRSWHVAMTTKIHAFLSKDTLRYASALGLYYFNKEHQADFIPSAELINACGLALQQDASEVIAYLDRFMLVGMSARAAHEAMVVEQLQLTPAFHQTGLTFKGVESRYFANIIDVWELYAKLIAFLQTPFHLIIAAEKIAKECGKIAGTRKGSRISAPDLEISTLGQGIRTALTEIKDLKKNPACKHNIQELISQCVVELSKISPSFTLKERDEIIKEQRAIIAELRAENTQLKAIVLIAPPSPAAMVYPSQGVIAPVNVSVALDEAPNDNALN